MRIAIASGVHLECAWPRLGPALGQRLRAAAQEAVVDIVGAASAADADHLVLAGSTVDNRTVTPKILSLLGDVLEAFEGGVTIVPGALDWATNDSPYYLKRWPDSVSVIEPGTPATIAPGVAATAATTPSPSAPRGRPDGAALLIVPSVTMPAAREARGGSGLTVVGTASTDTHGGVRGTGHVVAEPADPAGHVVLVDLDDDGSTTADTLQLSLDAAAPPSVDVSEIATSEQLAASVRQAVRAANQRMVRLTGQLAHGVLLPTTSRVEDLQDVALETDELTVVLPDGDHDATSSLDIFVRSTRDADAAPLTRHQAIALGLRALQADD